MVKAAPLVSFEISGVVDASESYGENMNFFIRYENGALSVQTSCWYRTLDAYEFSDYENFCEVYDGYSKEEFEKLRRCPHFILDSGEGEVVTEVPLDDPKVIDLHLTGDTVN